MNIPPGYCECGCGQKTKVASRTRASEGIRKGVHKRYVLGHNARTSPTDYITDPETGCWLWQRSIEPVTHGENCRRGANAILTSEKVAELRADFASAGLPKRTFARERATSYGVSHHCIRDILKGKTW